MLVSCPSCTTRYVVDPVSIGASGRRVKCVRCGEVWHQTLPDDVERVRPEERGAPIGEEAAPGLQLEEGDWHPGGAEAESATSDGDGANFIEELARQADEQSEVDAVSAALNRRRAQRPNLPATAKPKKRGQGAAVVALLVLLLGGLAGVGYVARAQIVALWPPALKLYETVGLPVDLEDTGLLETVEAGLSLYDIEAEWVDEVGSRVLWVRGRIGNDSDVSRRVPALRVILRDGDGAMLQDWEFSADSDRLPPGGATSFETSGTVDDSQPALMEVTLAPRR